MPGVTSEPLDVALSTRRATRRFGAVLGAALAPGDVVWLEGELGAGKTFLARAIARALGVPESEPVTSPTFALVHELEGRVPVVHADFYRLGQASELDDLGLAELVGGGAVTLVEWGARFADAVGGQGVVIRLEVVADGARKAHVAARGARGDAIVSTVRATIGDLERAPPARRVRVRARQR